MDTTPRERLKMLGARLPLPSVVKEIDGAIAELKEHWAGLLKLRSVAVLIHGDTTPAPEMPGADDSVAEKSVAKEEGTQPEARLALTVPQLIESYRTDERSGFHQVRHSTRENYRGLLRRIETDLGSMSVADLTSDRLQELFGDWSGGGERIPMARSLIAILR